MRVILRGGPGKTCTFPSTTVTVGEYAFNKRCVLSVGLNEGLKVLEQNCFSQSGIRKLVLPSSIESIRAYVFHGCDKLEHADLRTAHSLKTIGSEAFASCEVLRRVVLNDGLETICESCFSVSGLTEVSIPGSVRSIEDYAFSDS